MFKKAELKNISENPGVYIFKDSKNNIIYVGKALRLKDRVRSYFLKQSYLKADLLVNDVKKYSTIEVFSEVEALILEANLINKYKPKYNISLKDDKSFLYIAITKEEFPKVLSVRKPTNKEHFRYLYGPFPGSTSVRSVLKIIRKVFPFCSQSGKARKSCFYSHINLCNPCPTYIKKTDGKEYSELKQIYLKNIKYIKRFLDGDFKAIKKSLVKQMNDYSSQQMFEKAQVLNKQIQHIDYITNHYHSISNFLTDSNFLHNQQKNALSELKDLLKPYFPNIDYPARIEGIDISTISGKEASGSLVVFTNGEKDTASYRRFKIKKSGPDDVSMIEEVLARRLNHTNWPYPNLLLIDGGKPQLSAVVHLLNIKKIYVPVIGLAKKTETLVIPFNKSYKLIQLKRRSASLRLIQMVRDEAHRFARIYHHALRSRLFNNSLLA